MRVSMLANKIDRHHGPRLLPRQKRVLRRLQNAPPEEQNKVVLTVLDQDETLRNYVMQDEKAAAQMAVVEEVLTGEGPADETEAREQFAALDIGVIVDRILSFLDDHPEIISGIITLIGKLLRV
jgi:hypothetical protein